MTPGTHSFPIRISPVRIQEIRERGTPALNAVLDLYLESLRQDVEMRKSDKLVQDYLGDFRLRYTY